MEQIAERLTGKIQKLNNDQLVGVGRFVESLQACKQDRAETRAWAALSSRVFEKAWNNPEDDIYDAL
jgi:hypothetical protein